jgi:hypothetical protein
MDTTRQEPEMTPEQSTQVRQQRAADRMREIVAAGQMTAELMDMLGLKGSPGFMGQGSFGSGQRSAGYRRTR